ncbi:hypothetical protein L873DRAFT_1674534 [Choiromyces venosus 120613-1]|uniref:Uncharacterized protein n=1 Tax=Choiromyces venosus 120613-1 TaxID=1336337 RepID=A0A3N4JXQ8_9PEZI|nr:hypothetical protein L873DRAFT_1674534 [Choiromyces venosus 120613-1]
MDDPRRSRHSHRSRDRSHSPHHSSRHHRHRDRDRDSRSSSKSRDHHSRENHSRHHHHHHRRRHKRTRSPSPAVVRPLNAPRISRHDFELHKDVFADYLDIQKGLILSELDRAEAKGRFKRFVTHYNHGELARGWYDRIVNRKASDPSKVPEQQKSSSRKEEEPARPERKKQRMDTPQSDKKDGSEGENESENEESSEEEIVGPLLPGQQPSKRSRAPGPTIPSKEDLDFQKELIREDQTLQHLDFRHTRKQELKLEKERLEELVPRAAAGTHERKLEKKAELNAKMKSFREKSPELEVNEETLMGSGGTDSFKQRKAAVERKKNDREIRKEELLRARIAEREERLQQHRDKEEKTMTMLRQLASRFDN